MNKRATGQPSRAPQWRLRATVAGVAVLLATITFVWQAVIPGRARAIAGIACWGSHALV